MEKDIHLLITMPMSGITLGSQPVVSFNYGMGNAKRIKRAIWCITGLCVLFCSLMMVFTYTLSPFYVGMFTTDAAIRALYQDIYSYDCAPGGTVSAGDETTALGHVRRALFCSAFRKLIYFSGLLLLPRLVSAEAAFFSEPIADIFAATMTTVLFLKTFPGIVQETEMRPEFKE